MVKALALDEEVLKNRTARRFFTGQPINQYNRSKLFEGLGQALIHKGIVPVPPAVLESNVPMATILGDAFELAALRWDHLLATIQSRATRIEDIGFAAEQFLRLVVVDVAIRVFALLRLASLEPPTLGTPLWAEENGAAKLLRKLASDANLTRDQLAARLGVSFTSVDNWLDGKHRPSSENIHAVAVILADASGNGTTAEHIEANINRHLAFGELADLLVPWIGREAVVDLSTALIRFVYTITEDVRGMERPPIEDAPGPELTALEFGTAHPCTHVLLRNLAKVEKDTTWKSDILATTHWSSTVQRIALQSGGGRAAAGLAQDVYDQRTGAFRENELANLSEFIDPADEALDRLVTEASEWEHRLIDLTRPANPLDVFTSGLDIRRRIVNEFPTSPKAHVTLGSFLGMVGKHLRRRDLVDEGILECKIAAGLLPNWDNPAVEPGIMLANIGAFEEALEELEWAKESLLEETPHLLLNMGYVLMNLSRHSEALERIERVIDARPDYAMAYKFAARCAFALGDKRKGIRHAKNAMRFGEPEEYLAWKSGAYSP